MGVVFCVDKGLGKILALDSLRKKDVVVVKWCYLCKKSREDIDHSLLHCEVARELWSSILNLFSWDGQNILLSPTDQHRTSTDHLPTFCAQ
jgi:hypothetical protein